MTTPKKPKAAAKRAPKKTVSSSPKGGDTVTIDGKAYLLDDLSDQAKAQLANIRVTDQKLTQLEQELAIIRTARSAYANALAEELVKATPTVQ